MRGPILLDAGPLVSFLDRLDRYHEWAADQLREPPGPQFTCEAVIAEACYILRKVPGGRRAVVDLIVRGALVVPFRLEVEAAAVDRLLGRYADVPMSLADACLVRMSEVHDSSRVMTLDSDFRIYRKDGRNPIPLIAPPG